MARVVVTTDDGAKVWEFHDTVDSHAARFIPSAPGNRRTQALLRGLARAINDADIIHAGGDPERPSEAAMRLSEAERKDQ